MTRIEAAQFAREELNKHGLQDWSVRQNNALGGHYLGLCSHRDKSIILNSNHIDIHPTPEVINTIRHEVAHALVGPYHGHDELWAAKAKEIGCDSTSPCSNLSLSPEIIDAIRSGAEVEISFEEEVIRRPKYTVTRIQDKCEVCGKVAKTDREEVFTPPGVNYEWKVIWLECSHLVVKKLPKGTPFHMFQMGGDPACLHIWDKNTCTLCDRKRPYPFQVDGMRFLEAALAVNSGGAIFDEMGLGKTIQAQGYLHYHPENYPVLWFVKSGTKYQFAVSLIKWNGPEHCPQIIKTSNDWLIPGLKHYIVSYDMVVPKVKTNKKTGKVTTSGFDITKFDKIGIKTVILDECQQIKNPGSSRTQMVRKVVKGKKVIPLSGTPWKNRGSELFAVLNMMDPRKFWSEEHFKRTWVDYYWDGNYRKEAGIKNPTRFKEYIKDLCVRRERDEVMPELPTINRTKLFVQMEPTDEKIYDAAVEEFMNWFNQQSDSISGMDILAAMQKMRHLIGLAKIPATQEYVQEFIEDTDRKIVVFAHHKDVQFQLYEHFKKEFSEETDSHGVIPVFKIESAMNAQARFDVQELFNNSPQAILVASTLAAGEGINLQTCSDCVIHERQWNPANEEQAEGRFIRIGQVATSVNAVYAHADGMNTIDPQLNGIIERKRHSFYKAMSNNEAPVWNENALARELAEAIISGHLRKKNRLG